MSDQPKAPPLPPDDTPVIFDAAREKLPWRPEDALPMDDDGKILPGNDPLDEDPNDTGDQEGFDPEDLPNEEGRLLDPNMSKTDLTP
jgi:hypothetical protein